MSQAVGAQQIDAGIQALFGNSQFQIFVSGFTKSGGNNTDIFGFKDMFYTKKHDKKSFKTNIVNFDKFDQNIDCDSGEFNVKNGVGTMSYNLKTELGSLKEDWGVKEIDAALPDLTEKSSVNDKAGAVRITKGFANAIKGKALLWKGDYAGAKSALAAVINSGKYALVPSNRMGDLLHGNGKANEESVFEFCLEFDPSLQDYFAMAGRTGWNAHMTLNWRFKHLAGVPDKDGHTGQITDASVNQNGWGWMTPTGAFARKLIENDGMESARRKAWIKTYDEILYEIQWAKDPTPFVPGKTAAKATDGQRGVDNVGVYACEGFFNWKTVVHPDRNDLCSVGEGQRNFGIMRYPEVLLMYAECCAHDGDADGSGLKALQSIQNRAQANHVSSKCTLDEVKTEKMLELWMEGCRSADLIRWGDTATLESADAYVPTYRDKLTDKMADEHEGYISDEGADFYKKTYPQTLGFKKGKHELLPFPKREMDLNPEIKQNPNWN